MFTKTILLALTAFLSLTTAHFHIQYPPDRGDSDVTQARSPCGGLNTPSSKRTPWPLTGGRVSIESEHEEALTVVQMGLGDNPTSFPITLAPVFTQVGMGVFCWQTLAVPNGTDGIKDGAYATIQIRQKSDDSASWLFNCADIVFMANPPAPSGTCKNGTGVGAEPAPGSTTGSGNASTTGSSAKPSTAGAVGGQDIEILAGTVLGAVALLVGFLM